ncbi:MAG: TonB-dependent receptor [Nitrospinota bacterium]
MERKLVSFFVLFLLASSTAPCLADESKEKNQLEKGTTLLKNRVDLSGIKQAPGRVAGNALNPKISLAALFAGGGANEKDEAIKELQGGAHDPQKKGFTVQHLELSMSAAVDPYLDGQAHIIFQIDDEGESVMEVEEVFFTTLSLPYSLQVKGGQFFTEFGRLNPTHPHTWGFVDQPVVNTRMFGGDGLRNSGMRISWLTPLPWYSEFFLGFQNPNGETAVSFIGEAGEDFGGRPLLEREINDIGDLLYSGRLLQSFDLSDTTTANLGFSGLTGPNSSGENKTTEIYGVDLYIKWKPLLNQKGWPFLVWQTEGIIRRYEAGSFNDGTTVLPKETLRDWGLYSQILWGFSPGWTAGVRYDAAEGKGGNSDPLRDFRRRSSGSITWYPTEFSKFRVQYNHDDAEHLQRPVQSLWFQFEFMIGAHGAHTF